MLEGMSGTERPTKIQQETFASFCGLVCKRWFRDALQVNQTRDRELRIRGLEDPGGRVRK